MRNLKKIFAIVLTVALVFSMISVGVFAEDPLTTTINFRASATDAYTTTISQAKPGKVVYADIYVPAGEYKSLAVSYAPKVGTITEDDITVHVDGSAVDAYNQRDNKAQAKWTSKVTVPDATPLMTVKISIPAEQAVADGTLVLGDGAFSYNITAVTAGTAVEGKLNIVEGFVGTSAEFNGTTTFDIGTDVASELAKGTAKVSNIDSTKTAEGYATSGWTVEADKKADYEANKPGTYTFSGVVTPDSAKAAEWEGALNVSATVTLNALTTGTPTVTYSDVTVFQEAEKTYSADEVVALVKAAITEIKVENGSISDTFNVENAVVTASELSAEEIGTSVDATVKVSGASANGFFNLEETTVATVNVKVVAAEITDANEVGLKLSTDSVTSSTTNLTVTVTRSDERIEETGEVIVSVKVAGSEDAPIEFSGTFEEGATELKIDLKSSEFEALLSSLNVGQKLEIALTYDGAAVYPTEDKEVVSIPVVNASSGSTPSGIPSGIGSSTGTQYNITVGKTENGTISVASKAAKGDTVTVTATPDSGYKLDKITVVTTSGTDVTVTGNTFVMPGYSVTVTATFVEGTEPVNPPTETDFTDVPVSHWAYQAIGALKTSGIVNGVTETTFNPDGNVTRAEFTKMVAALFDLKASTEESKFEDCTADDWFTPYVIAASEAGYVNGVDDTHFNPNDQITRQDVCTILGRALNLAETADAGFSDAAEIADYADQYVKAFVALGIVNGYEDGTFRPEAPATRAEAAKIIYGIVQLDAAGR